jgi:hypothetical protein
LAKFALKIPLTGRLREALSKTLHDCDMKTGIMKLGHLSMDLLFGGLRWGILIGPVLVAVAAPALAADAYIVTETTEYEDISDAEPTLSSKATAQFGPFHVVANDRVELIGAVDQASPAQFRALLSRHPGVKRIDMIDCPGSEDDDANLAVARMIRAAGIATHVPSGGSIRSGGVELFLAGQQRTIDKGAEIGVHSWQDSDGLEASDFAADDPVHKPYLDFYVDMGMKPEAARAFYDFTNHAASYNDLHVMSEAELQRFGLLQGS